MPFAEGKPVVIAGELDFLLGAESFPAVVLIHGWGLRGKDSALDWGAEPHWGRSFHRGFFHRSRYRADCH
jgi:hypothetical protein